MDALIPYLPALTAAGAVVLSLVLGLIVRGVVLPRLARLSAATASAVDDAVVASLRRPVLLWFLLAGLWIAAQAVPLPAARETRVEKILLSVAILSVTFWAAGLVGRLLSRDAAGGGSASSTGVVRNAARAGVLAVGLLVLLSTLGISIAPVLTTLGIGGIAIALGLQQTLSNLFAGMQVTIAGNIRVGDFVRLQSGEEGYIDDIHWRETRIRTLANNFILVPNSKLAESILTNHYLPARDLAVRVEVGVHYGSDLSRVEALTLEVARRILTTVPGAVPDFEPLVRFHTFGDSSINFTVVLRADEFANGFVVRHEFIKALKRAYDAEKIVIPYPIRALNLDQEKARPLPLG